MDINIETKDIPFSNLQVLYKFEDDVCERIKILLNNEYSHISVKLNIELNKWDGNPIRVRHNANIAISKSNELINDINTYLSTRDDIGDIIMKKYSLIIKIILSEKK